MRTGGNKDSSRQFFTFPSLNSYILHSVNLYQDFVQFVAKIFSYLYANKSLMQPAAVFLSSFFVTLSLHCKYPIRFAIKGATSFSCQGKSQVAGECYTAVEVGQKLCLRQLLVRTYTYAFHHSASNPIALSKSALFQRPQKMTDALQRQCVFGWSGEDLPSEAEIGLARGKLTAFRSLASPDAAIIVTAT